MEKENTITSPGRSKLHAQMSISKLRVVSAGIVLVTGRVGV